MIAERTECIAERVSIGTQSTHQQLEHFGDRTAECWCEDDETAAPTPAALRAIVRPESDCDDQPRGQIAKRAKQAPPVSLVDLLVAEPTPCAVIEQMGRDNEGERDSQRDKPRATREYRRSRI